MNFITKKLQLGTLCLAAVLFLGINPALNAQSTKESKKVVIITKKIDKDGKETV